MKKIGIIGCGAIGSEFARRIEDEFSDRAELIGLCDVDQEKAERLASSLKKKPPLLSEDELITRAELILEAASASVSAGIASKCVSQGKEVLVMSTGGLLGREEVLSSARNTGAKVYLPSGALCGVDGVKAAAMGGIDKATLTTRKPPRALEGAPFIEKNKIDLGAIKEEVLLFEGSAEEAVKHFPANVNVAATLSLAGIGARDTKVKIMTSPDYKFNSHEVELQGEFGKLTARTENVASPQNPKTSFLAVLSAIATLKKILSPVEIGT